jgi:hypothetical protein
MTQERNVRRRVSRSASEKKALLSAWEASGLSARAFAKREDVRTSCLWRWKRAASAAAKPTKAASRSRPAITFAPVHVTKAHASHVMVPDRTVAVSPRRDPPTRAGHRVRHLYSWSVLSPPSPSHRRLGSRVLLRTRSLPNVHASLRPVCSLAPPGGVLSVSFTLARVTQAMRL